MKKNEIYNKNWSIIILYFIYIIIIISNSDRSTAEKNRIGYEDKDDGGFWMGFQDWIDEFELCTICLLPGLDPEEDTVSEE